MFVVRSGNRDMRRTKARTTVLNKQEEPRTLVQNRGEEQLHNKLPAFEYSVSAFYLCKQSFPGLRFRLLAEAPLHWCPERAGDLWRLRVAFQTT